ncbi:MAG: hypothetical protein K2G36_01890 [Ruminococcus sp.]|nr:hypothetical protein [Ruminococcus sp.]
MAEIFKLVMYPLIKPSSPEFFKAEISDNTKNIIDTLYNSANSDFVSGRKNLIMKLNHSFFCCCFEEGFIIYTFSPETSHGRLAMNGVFVPAEYIRTAWKLYLKDILYIVAGDVMGRSVFRGEYDVINEMSANARAKLDENYRNRIEICYGKIKKERPYNFAMTSYPRNSLPVNFVMENAGNDVIPESDYESGQIKIHEPVVKNAKEKYISEEPIIRNIYIRKSTKKGFLDIRKNMMIEQGYKRTEIKQFLEDTERSIQTDNVWYIINEDTEDRFICALDYVTINSLESGVIDFAKLCSAVEQAITRYKDNTEKTESSSGHNDRKDEFKEKVLRFFRKK